MSVDPPVSGAHVGETELMRSGTKANTSLHKKRNRRKEFVRQARVLVEGKQGATGERSARRRDRADAEGDEGQ